MIDKSKVLADINVSIYELIETITAFPEQYLNTRPGDNSWSAAETAEHILIVETLLNGVLTGNTEAIERAPDEKKKNIADVFLDFEKKLISTTVINPTEKKKDKDSLIMRIRECRQRLSDIVQYYDLDDLCTDFSHKLFGSMTRLEWAYFNIYHTQRHINQIKSIQRSLEA